jgi:hypothetical protein
MTWGLGRGVAISGLSSRQVQGPAAESTIALK